MHTKIINFFITLKVKVGKPINFSLFLIPDASGLKEADQVRDSQEKVVQSLQEYTTSHYPNMPSKFGELLLRIPELQRVCQVSINDKTTELVLMLIDLSNWATILLFQYVFKQYTNHLYNN